MKATASQGESNETTQETASQGVQRDNPGVSELELWQQESEATQPKMKSRIKPENESVTVLCFLGGSGFRNVQVNSDRELCLCLKYRLSCQGSLSVYEGSLSLSLYTHPVYEG